MTVQGIGVDLVAISRLRRAVERWQERFLHRVFTEGELRYCMSRRDPIPHLAARFAAKEAGLKALGTGLRLGVRWRELEVRRERGQAPRLHLSGASRTIANGAETLLLSLTHEGDYAMAQAMLVTSEGATPTAPVQLDRTSRSREAEPPPGVRGRSPRSDKVSRSSRSS